MKWTNSRQSGNVEDRRGMGGGAVAGGGLGTLILGLAYFFLTGDPTPVLQQATPSQRSTQTQRDPNAPDKGKQFVAAVLGDTEDVWTALFKRRGLRYQDPKLVLFTDRVQSACGIAGASAGPFYCPGDQKVYIDLAFYQELRDKYKAPGDFAQAYVIAHEIGHHVQNQLGTMDKVDRLRGRLSKTQQNALSVRTELQADYYAGVWAHYAQQRGLLEAGDIDEALTAASAIGDDRLQQQSRGYVVPDSFTHGTSQQRIKWFKRGFQSGDINGGDTFNARDL